MIQFEYEYLHIRYEDNPIKVLNEWGADGWEAICCSDDYNVRRVYAILKRAVQKHDEARLVTIEQVLNDINAGNVKVTARVRMVLYDEKELNGKVYLRDVTLKHRNFGKKSQTELQELKEHYGVISKTSV